MKKGVRKAILKVVEVGFSLGIIGGSLYGMSATLMNHLTADATIERYKNDNAVYELIQKDIDDLNAKYDLGEVSFSDYRDYKEKIEDLKENAAKEVFGEKYQEQSNKKNLNMGLFFIPFVTMFGGGVLTAAEIAVKEESFLNDFAESIDEKRMNSYKKRLLNALNKDKDEDKTKIKDVECIGKYDHNLIVGVIDNDWNRLFYVYPTSTALDLEDFNKYSRLGDFKALDELIPKLKKQVADIVSNVSPSYTGYETGMLEHFHLKEPKKPGENDYNDNIDL